MLDPNVHAGQVVLREASIWKLAELQARYTFSPWHHRLKRIGASLKRITVQRLRGCAGLRFAEGAGERELAARDGRARASDYCTLAFERSHSRPWVSPAVGAITSRDLRRKRHLPDNPDVVRTSRDQRSRIDREAEGVDSGSVAADDSG